jgi:hypothetical protein
LACGGELRSVIAYTFFSRKSAVLAYLYCPCRVNSGEISLENVELNTAALSSLELPVQVRYGTIRRFSVSVPWTRLEKEPVRVLIEGVYLLVAPLDKKTWSAEEVFICQCLVKLAQA